MKKTVLILISAILAITAYGVVESIPEPNTVIILNGPSSSGKSTIARELQNKLGVGYLHVELDDFAEMFLPEDIDEPRVYADAVSLLASAAEDISELRYSQIIDAVLEGEESMPKLLNALRGHNRVIKIGVYCDPDILDEREKGRERRRPGLAREQAEYIHYDIKYDMKVDTSHTSSEEIAKQIIEEFWLGK